MRQRLNFDWRKYKGTQEVGTSSIYNVTLLPGINNFQFRAQNYGSGPNPAGLLVTVVNQNNQILFSTNSDWKYKQVNSSTYYTPIESSKSYIIDYQDYCTGNVNGPVYINALSNQISKINTNQNNCIQKCINKDNCNMVLMSDDNTCHLYKDSQNVSMYCIPQTIPSAQNYGRYILKNPKVINNFVKRKPKKYFT